MQNFFGIRLRLTIVLLVLGGFTLTHLPQHHAVKEYNSFSNWVMQHLTEADTAAETESENPNSEQLRHLLHKMMSDPHGSDTPADPGSDRARIIPYLYLAWSQHQDASDMAGTFSHERLSFQLILKHYAALLSGTLFSASGTETFPSSFKSSLQFLRSGFSSFCLRALISGQSVNAP